MNQTELHREVNDIIQRYCKGDHNKVFQLCFAAKKNLDAMEISIDAPLYHIARALAIRDIINAWENTYTNPAEL